MTLRDHALMTRNSGVKKWGLHGLANRSPRYALA